MNNSMILAVSAVTLLALLGMIVIQIMEMKAYQMF